MHTCCGNAAVRSLNFEAPDFGDNLKSPCYNVSCISRGDVSVEPIRPKHPKKPLKQDLGASCA